MGRALLPIFLYEGEDFATGGLVHFYAEPEEGGEAEASDEGFCLGTHGDGVVESVGDDGDE